MYDFNQEVYVVDFVLKDNRGILKDCALFKSLDKGENSIEDYDQIQEALKQDRVYFQNRCVNGCTLPRSNIEGYEIHKIKLRDF